MGLGQGRSSISPDVSLANSGAIHPGRSSFSGPGFVPLAHGRAPEELEVSTMRHGQPFGNVPVITRLETPYASGAVAGPLGL